MATASAAAGAESDESAKVSNVCGNSMLIFPSRAQIGYALKECGFNEKRDSSSRRIQKKKNASKVLVTHFHRFVQKLVLRPMFH